MFFHRLLCNHKSVATRGVGFNKNINKNADLRQKVACPSLLLSLGLMGPNRSGCLGTEIFFTQKFAFVSKGVSFIKMKRSKNMFYIEIDILYIEIDIFHSSALCRFLEYHFILSNAMHED